MGMPSIRLTAEPEVGSREGGKVYRDDETMQDGPGPGQWYALKLQCL